MIGTYQEALEILRKIRISTKGIEGKIAITDCIHALEEAWEDEAQALAEDILRDSIVPTEKQFSVIKGGKS